MRRDNRRRWEVTGRKERANQEVSPAVRRKILHRYRRCWLAFPGVCTGKSTQVHHVEDMADGGTNDEDNLVGVCKECHEKHSAQVSQKRAVAAAWDWKRGPEKHPGVLD